MVKFNKVTELNYSVVEGSEIILNEVNDYVEKISKHTNISKDDYSTFSNDMLFHAILTRVVSKYFLSTTRVTSDVAMNIIEIRVNDKTAYISIGELPDIENKGISKYVDSNYSR